MEHFNLVELVAADHAPLFFAVGAGLAAEAGGIGIILQRQFFGWQDFVAVVVVQHHFRGGIQAKLILGPEKVIAEFRQVARGIGGSFIQQIWRQNEVVAIGAMMLVKIVE